MNSSTHRTIVYYRHYFRDFFDKQPKAVQKKINWTLGLIESLDRIPSKYFNHMSGTEGIYEIRVEVGSNIFRIFSFFDEGYLVVLMNAFQKKSQKTPTNELDLAVRLKKQYFDEKENE